MSDHPEPVLGDPADSFVVDALLDALSAVRPENGYHTDLGRRVTEEDQDIGSCPTPCTILDEELQEPGENSPIGAYDIAGYYKVRVALENNNGPAAAKPLARKARADLKRLFHSGLTYNAPVNGALEPLKLRVRYRQSALNGGGIITGRAYLWILFEVKHIESRKDPSEAKPC